MLERPVLKTLYVRTVAVPVLPLGSFRSLPAEVGSGAPLGVALPPEPMEHPQPFTTGAGYVIRPMEPSNGSKLALPRLL
jgi:hypothetical protein